VDREWSRRDIHEPFGSDHRVQVRDGKGSCIGSSSRRVQEVQAQCVRKRKRPLRRCFSSKGDRAPGDPSLRKDGFHMIVSCRRQDRIHAALLAPCRWLELQYQQLASCFSWQLRPRRQGGSRSYDTGGDHRREEPCKTDRRESRDLRYPDCRLDDRRSFESWNRSDTAV
jgi:hypothetical protein